MRENAENGKRRVRGKVVFWDDRGWGFIVDALGRKFHVHHSNVVGSDSKFVELAVGTNVTFEPANDGHSAVAKAVIERR